MTNEEAKEIMCKVTFYWELGEQTLTQNQINEAIDMAIKALEQQPCEDWKFYYNHGYAQAKRDLARPTGKWIVYDVVKFGDFVGTEKYECSKCHHRVGVFKSNFCPNCGSYNGGYKNEADN